VIIVVGENVVDLIPAATSDGDMLRVTLGGGPANTAVAVARLGTDVTYPCRFGADAFAERFRARLVAGGVDLSSARTSDAPSTMAIASPDAAGAARYDFWLDGAADFGIDALPEPAVGDILHVGSVAAYWPPGADVIEAWLARYHETCTVTFDVNLRPFVLARQPDALDRLERLVRLAHVVKASDDDIAAAYPGAMPASVARSWLGAGPELVVLTHAERGASAHVAGREPVTVPAPDVIVADTIGAGDAAMGALLVRLAAEGRGALPNRLDETLRYVCAAAAVTCTRPGAYAPDPAEVAALLRA